jgi:hypothetical protein
MLMFAAKPENTASSSSLLTSKDDDGDEKKDDAFPLPPLLLLPEKFPAPPLSFTCLTRVCWVRQVCGKTKPDQDHLGGGLSIRGILNL